MLCSLVYRHFIWSSSHADFPEKVWELPHNVSPQHVLICVDILGMVTLVPWFVVFKVFSVHIIPHHLLVNTAYNPTPFACQHSPLPRSLVGCHLTFLLKLPSPACWQGRFFPTCSSGFCLFLAVLYHQKGSMEIKGNTLLLTPAMQLGLDPQNPPPLPTAFPFFSRIKETPPKPPMSLTTTSSTM